MTKILFSCALAIGAMAILWVAFIFFGEDKLGLGVTVLIGLVYAIGAWELVSFRRATRSLNQSLDGLVKPIDDFHQWLSSFDPSLQNSVRLRVGGERNGLPAPVVTPYLVGLLVMLGLLGTFVGMVDTLRGAVVALEGSSELEAIRAGLAAPIEGLGIAFGTSVAGVAASAMLGLLSTISRRERLLVSHLLDTKISDTLRNYSGQYQQRLAFKAMQDQAHVFPDVARQLGAVVEKIEKMGESMETRLLTSQEQFQNTITELYRELNDSVDQSLKTSLVESANLINSSVAPMAEKTLFQLNESTLETQQRLIALNEKQLSATDDAMHATNKFMREALDSSLAQQTSSTEALVDVINSATSRATEELQDSSKALLGGFTASTEQWANLQREQALQFTTTIGDQLTRLREDEGRRGDIAVERLNQLESVATTHLQALGQSLEEPLMRLIETASETPKAAAEVIEKLRGEMTKNLERDNDFLDERARLMMQLDSLSTTLEASSTGQRDAIDQLVERSAETLSKVGEQFGERLEGESSKLAGVVENFASSSVEIASLGDAFSAAVTLFSESNRQLVENLSRIETSLEQSSSRSDEQLAYYVAQAREIIDYNLLTHKEIVDALKVEQSHSAQMSVG